MLSCAVFIILTVDYRLSSLAIMLSFIIQALFIYRPMNSLGSLFQESSQIMDIPHREIVPSSFQNLCHTPFSPNPGSRPGCKLPCRGPWPSISSYPRQRILSALREDCNLEHVTAVTGLRHQRDSLRLRERTNDVPRNQQNNLHSFRFLLISTEMSTLFMFGQSHSNPADRGGEMRGARLRSYRQLFRISSVRPQPPQPQSRLSSPSPIAKPTPNANVTVTASPQKGSKQSQTAITLLQEIDEKCRG